MIDFGIFQVDSIEEPTKIMYKGETYIPDLWFVSRYAAAGSHKTRIDTIEKMVSRIKTKKGLGRADDGRTTTSWDYRKTHAGMQLERLGDNKLPILKGYHKEYVKLKKEIDACQSRCYQITVIAERKTTIDKGLWADWLLDMAEGRETNLDVLVIFEEFLKDVVGITEELPHELVVAIREFADSHLDEYKNTRVKKMVIIEELNDKIEAWAYDLGVAKSVLRQAFDLMKGKKANQMAIKKRFYEALDNKNGN